MLYNTSHDLKFMGQFIARLVDQHREEYPCSASSLLNYPGTTLLRGQSSQSVFYSPWNPSSLNRRAQVIIASPCRFLHSLRARLNSAMHSEAIASRPGQAAAVCGGRVSVEGVHYQG